jgi:hypothetical protein
VKCQVKKYNEGFEKSLFKLLQIVEREEGWKILSTEESIIGVQEEVDNLMI